MLVETLLSVVGGGGGGGGGVPVMATSTVLAALALATLFCATLLLSDSSCLLFTARTAKYQVPPGNAVTDVPREAESLMTFCCPSELALVPYNTLKPARSASVELSVFCVGAVQVRLALPLFQVQVSVYDLLAVIVARVSLPEANFV